MARKARPSDNVDGNGTCSTAVMRVGQALAHAVPEDGPAPGAGGDRRGVGDVLPLRL